MRYLLLCITLTTSFAVAQVDSSVVQNDSSEIFYFIPRFVSHNAIAEVHRDTVNRIFEYEDKEFLLQFIVDRTIGWVPDTYPQGVPHYSARLFAYQEDGDSYRLICSPFYVVFTDGGCFEDDSIYLLGQARKRRGEEQCR